MQKQPNGTVFAALCRDLCIGNTAIASSVSMLCKNKSSQGRDYVFSQKKIRPYSASYSIQPFKSSKHAQNTHKITVSMTPVTQLHLWWMCWFKQVSPCPVSHVSPYRVIWFTVNVKVLTPCSCKCSKPSVGCWKCKLGSLSLQAQLYHS